MTLSAAFYFDFAWFREQFCLVVCPYGRLQSLLHDGSSIVIGYDGGRGEPRAPLRRTHLRVVDDATTKSGDCIDCQKCVWTCPTGIDIRNGFQMECIACTQCIDVCDDVMDKIGRPRGLIRHAPLQPVEGESFRVMRPRLVIYGALAFGTLALFAAALLMRSPFEANVIRAVGVPWTIEGNQVRNQVEVHLVNKRPDLQRYEITVVAPARVHADVKSPRVTLPSLGHVRVPVVLLAERGEGSNPAAEVIIREADTGTERRIPLRLLGPP